MKTKEEVEKMLAHRKDIYDLLVSSGSEDVIIKLLSFVASAEINILEEVLELPKTKFVDDKKEGIVK